MKNKELGQSKNTETLLRKAAKFVAAPLVAGMLTMGCANPQMDVRQPNIKENIERGRSAWVNEYYPFLALTGDATSTKVMAASLMAASLDPKSAVAFYDYLRVVRLNCLEGHFAIKIVDGKKTVIDQGQGTRKLVTDTVVRLYASATNSGKDKITEYFQSIRNIALRYGTDANAFRKALVEFNTDIDRNLQK
jgi:hypothetical protein